MPLVISRRPAILILILYFFSGVASIAYEVLWSRFLALQFGVSIFGVTSVIAAFMAGLGIGGFWGQRLTRYRQPLVFFAVLEALIGLYAGIFPHIITYIWQYTANDGAGFDIYSWYLLYGLVVVVVMMLPAIAMGIGLPLILEIARTLSLSTGVIYGVNTMGGALGAVLPLLLLPVLGWGGSHGIIIAMSFTIAIMAILIKKYQPETAVIPALHTEHTLPSVAVFALVAYATIGAGAIILQIAWTRLYGMIFLRTEYVMALILALYLLGLALGSFLSRFVVNIRRCLVWMPIFAAGFILLGLGVFPLLSAWVTQAEFSGFYQALLWQGLVLGVISLPVTLLLGAWFPVLNRTMEDSYRYAPQWYGANALGSAAGAVLALLLLLPHWGSYFSVAIAAWLILLGGLYWSRHKAIFLVIAAFLALTYYLKAMPSVNDLQPGLYAKSQDLWVHEDAIALTHVVEQADGQRLLLSDLQRIDASTEATAVAVQQNQARLPLLLKPDAQHILFLGLGTGITAAGSLALPQLQRTAVEISAGAIAASQSWFASINENINSHLRIYHDDLRRFLLVNSAQYDLIVGDLFHPDFVGRGALLSVQQFERVRTRLLPGGVFVQWLALNQYDLYTLQVVLRSFKTVFPTALMWLDGTRLALVGGVAPGLVNISKISSQWLLWTETQQAALSGSEGLWTWMGRFLGEMTLPVGPIQDDWHPVVEFALPKIRYHSQNQLQENLHWLIQLRPGWQQAAQALGVIAAEYPVFERAYVATDFAVRSLLAELESRPQEAQYLLQMGLKANSRDRWLGFALADKLYNAQKLAKTQGVGDKELLEIVLKLRHDHVEALRALWHIESAQQNEPRARHLLIQLKRLIPLDQEIRMQPMP